MKRFHSRSLTPQPVESTVCISVVLPGTSPLVLLRCRISVTVVPSAPFFEFSLGSRLEFPFQLYNRICPPGILR